MSLCVALVLHVCGLCVCCNDVGSFSYSLPGPLRYGLSIEHRVVHPAESI